MNDLSVCDIDNLMANMNSNSRVHLILSIFKEAIDDWPENVQTLFEYNNEVRVYIKAKTSKSNIERAMQSADIVNDTWKAESLAVILRVFDCFGMGETLDQIIKTIIQETFP